jgi:ferredoxin--NADP+ reductase/benzoate/toluate 1,2-dioxygenase reductase subunit
MIQHSFTKHDIKMISRFAPNIMLVRIDRQNKRYIAGQHITINVPEIQLTRDYSIYSPEKEPYFDIIIKDDGGDEVAKLFRNANNNIQLECNHPYGQMVLQRDDDNNLKHLFIATGIGLVPFHAIIKSNPGLNYEVLHGISYTSDAFDREEYDKDRYHRCVSRESGGDFDGSVTEYLKQDKIAEDTYCYISGNPGMAFEVYHILLSQGIPYNRILSDQI